MKKFTKRQAKIWALCEMSAIADAHAEDNLGVNEGEEELCAQALREVAEELAQMANKV